MNANKLKILWVAVLPMFLVLGCDQIKTQLASATKSDGGPTKTCFHCSGTGQTACEELDCKNGMVPCPGTCLKKTTPGWTHLDWDTRFPKTELFWGIMQSNGKMQYYAMSHHLGGIITLENGMAKDCGPCPTCKGKTVVKCTKCDPKGQAVCSLCEGKKVVPATWTAFDNPKRKKPPVTLALKDGTTLQCRIESRIGSAVYVRTADGKQQELRADEIVSESKTDTGK